MIHEEVFNFLYYIDIKIKISQCQGILFLPTFACVFLINWIKGIETSEIHFYNTFEHIWFKCVFGTENYEFWICGFNKSYSVLCHKDHGCKIIYMIYTKYNPKKFISNTHW
jgi:hypothetical protein